MHLLVALLQATKLQLFENFLPFRLPRTLQRKLSLHGYFLSVGSNLGQTHFVSRLSIACVTQGRGRLGSFTKWSTNCREQVRSEYWLCLFQSILKQLRGTSRATDKASCLLMQYVVFLYFFFHFFLLHLNLWSNNKEMLLRLTSRCRQVGHDHIWPDSEFANSCQEFYRTKNRSGTRSQILRSLMFSNSLRLVKCQIRIPFWKIQTD